MEITTLSFQQNSFSLSGICPHCSCRSVFTMVNGVPPQAVFTHRGFTAQRLPAAMQCQGCRKYILGIAVKLHSNNDLDFELEAYYPRATPNETVPDELSTSIASDYKEALRCRGVDALNATVEMCRRVVEASCNELGAEGKKLVDKIDSLAAQQKITAPLREMAHQIRLGGNIGAHPQENGAEDAVVVDSDYADAVLEFTAEYLQHVYVMPAKLQRFGITKKQGGS